MQFFPWLYCTEWVEKTDAFYIQICWELKTILIRQITATMKQIWIWKASGFSVYSFCSIINDFAEMNNMAGGYLFTNNIKLCGD